MALKSIISNSALFVGLIVRPEGFAMVSFIHGSQNASQISVKTGSPAASRGGFIDPILQMGDWIRDLERFQSNPEPKPLSLRS